MANRYWVGGSGTWNDTSTTNWSATSGGSGGASAPTAADSVFFDSSSNATSYTVTIANGTGYPKCLNLTVSGPASGSVTLSGTGQPIIYGSMTLAATGVIFTNSYIYFAAATAVTITTNGVSLSSTSVIVGYDISNSTHVNGGTYTLGSSLTCGALYVDGGTFTTSSSNYSVTLSTDLNQNSGGAPTLTLNASTVNIGGSLNVNVGTINAGTSTINMTGTTPVFSGNRQTYYIVNFTNTSAGNNGYYIYNQNTFSSLNFACPSGVGIFKVQIDSNQTINQMAITGTYSITSRVMFQASSQGTPITLNISTPTLANCDFRDIAISPAVNLSSNAAGDCGGNSGITFPTAKTVYWNLAGTKNWSDTGWATSSGGTPSAANFPLAQDTCIFDNAGGAGTVTIDANWNIGSLSVSGRQTTMTLDTGATTPTIYGTWYNGPSSYFTLTGTGALTFSNRSTQYIWGNGVTFPQPITINCPGGTIGLLNSDLTTTNSVTLTQGTLTLITRTLSCSQFDSNNTNTITLAFGTGNITIPNGSLSAFNLINATGLTITGTPVVNLTGTGTYFLSLPTNNATSAHAVAINITSSTGTILLDNGGPCVAGSINFTGSTAVFQLNNGITMYGNLTLGSGQTTTLIGGTLTFAGTTNQTMTTNGVTINFPIATSGTGGTFTISDAVTSSSTFTSSGSKGVNFGTFTTATFSSVALGHSGLLSLGYVGLVLTGSGTCFSDTASRGVVSSFGTSYITATSTSAKTMSFFNGNNYFGIKQAGTGALTLTTSTGAGTIGLNGGSLGSLTNTVSPTTISITGGLTVSGVVLNLNGTSGNLVTLGSTNTTPVTLVSPSNQVSTSNYTTVSYITGSTTNTPLWRFLNSTNGGNNTNLTFAKIYYWVGGTGTWDPTTTTNWSLTSGGSGGAGVPTYADDVVFDANSSSVSYTVSTAVGFNGYFNASGTNPTVLNITSGTGTALAVGQSLGGGAGFGYITSFGTGSGSTGTYNISGTPGNLVGGTVFSLASCYNMTFLAPASGSVTLSAIGGGYPSIAIYGSASLPATGFIFSNTNYTAFWLFQSNYPGNTINTNGNALYSGVAFGGGTAGASGSWTLASALTLSGPGAFGSLGFTGGTFNTGNYNINCAGINDAQLGTGVARAVNLGSSTITVSGSVTFQSTGQTLNAGTSTINIINSTTFNGGGLSYYNLSIGNGFNLTITGSNSYNNFTAGGTSASTITFTAGTTQTVANLNINGTSGSLIRLASSTTSPYTITRTTAGVNQCSYCSVSYMTGTATATGGGTVYWRFTNSTNGGNNTNLIFANTYYWVGGTGTWDTTTTTNWSLSSGGSGATGPPGQWDDVVFDANSNATSYTVYLGPSNSNCYNLTMSGPASGTLTGFLSSIGGNTYLAVWNNLTIAATGVSITGLSYLYLAGLGGGTITTNGINFGTAGTVVYLGVNNFYPGGTMTLGSAFTCYYLHADSGIFNTNNYALTVTGTFDTGSTLTYYPTLNFGSSTVNITGTGSGTSQFTMNAGATINAGSSTINMTNATSNFFGGGYTYYIVNFTNTTAGNSYSITGTNTFNTLSVASPGSAGIIKLSLGGDVTTNSLTLGPGSGGNENRRVFLCSDTLGTQRTLRTSGIASYASDFRDINFFSGPIILGNAGDCGGNSGITFPTAKTVYWNLPGLLQSWSATGWATYSGGTPSAANFPLAQDTATFTEAGVASTVQLDAAWNIGTIDASARTTAMTLQNVNGAGYFQVNIYGSVNLSSAVTMAAYPYEFGYGGWYFYGRGNTQSITTNGQVIPSINVFNIGGIVQIMNNMTTMGGFFPLYGTFKFNNYTLTLLTTHSPYFQIAYGNGQTIDFGTSGAITYSGANIPGSYQLYIGGGLNFTIAGTPTVNMSVSATSGTFSPALIGLTQAQTVNLNITSGSYIVDLSNLTVGGLGFNGFTGSLATSSTGCTIYGSLSLSSGMTVSGYTGTMTLSSIYPTINSVITTNGQTIAFPLVFTGGGFAGIGSALTSTSSVTLTNCFWQIGSNFFFNITVNNMVMNGGGLYTSPYQTITLTGSGNCWNFISGGITYSTAGSAKLSLTSSSPKTFIGGNTNYGYINLNQGGTGTLTITGNNTFYSISNSV